VSKRELTFNWGYMREGDKFLRFDSTADGTKVVIEREEPDLPTGAGSVILATTTRGNEILVRPAIGNGRASWASLSVSPGGTIWRLDEDILSFEPLVVHKTVLYGDIRSVLTDYGVVLDADDNLARALMDLFKGER
jgi:hypothetical protein